MTKVSIVVPVYNSSSYLEAVVRSLVNQSYGNCEIILVNDGSTDDSLEIMKSFEERYDNIICATQSNQGAGAARNLGIALSTGEYVTFMDSDDEVTENFVKSYIEAIKPNEPYVVAGGYAISFNGKPLKEKRITKERLAIMKAPAVCFRMFNMEWLKKNNLNFGTYKIGEDLNFSGKAQLLYTDYSLTSRPEYHYFVRSGSLIGTADYSQFDLLSAVADLENFAKKRDLFEQNKAQLEYMVITHVLMAGMKRAAEGKLLETALYVIPEFVEKTHQDWYKNPYIEEYADEEEKAYLMAVYNGDEAGMRKYAENHW